IVYWQWNGRDPSGQAPYQQNFFNSIGGTTWPASQTQYCENATGVGTTCTTGPFVGNPAGVLKGTWSDNTNPIPNSPTDADIPYQTDAGANCGQNFVNSGSAGLLDGVSIVGGHEFAEAATDPNPGLGW